VPFCEHCGEEIGYLPFNCNYCGGTFCKRDRLPENHNCTFELKHKPVIQGSPRKGRQKYQDATTPMSKEHLNNGPRKLKKYLKRQDKQRRQIRKLSERRSRSQRGPGQLGNGTRFIILMIFIFSIIEFIRLAIYMETSIGFENLGGLNALISLYIWRAFTAPFIYGINYDSMFFFGFFMLFFMIYFLRFIGKMLEFQLGAKKLVKFYFLCVGFHWILYALLDLPFALYYPNDLYVSVLIPMGSASAAILGLICLSILPILNRQVTGIVSMVPMRMKGRTFLIVIVLITLLPGLLAFLTYGDIYYLVISIADLGGIIAAYLVVKQKIRL